MENIIPFVISVVFITICFLLTHVEERIGRKRRKQDKLNQNKNE